MLAGLVASAADKSPKNPITQPDAIIFDLDGTLIDRGTSISRYAILFQANFPELVAGKSSADIRALLVTADGHGYRAEQRAGDVAEGLDSPLSADHIDRHWKQNFPQCSVLAAGALYVLSELEKEGLRLGLITRSIYAQRTKLTALGLERFFQSIAISEQFAFKKPNPRIFLHTLEELGVRASRSWFVGDHPVNGVWGGRAGRDAWVPATGGGMANRRRALWN